MKLANITLIFCKRRLSEKAGVGDGQVPIKQYPNFSTFPERSVYMNIRKLLLLVSLVSLSSPIFAMDTDSGKTKVTEACAGALEDINYDGTAICFFCEGVFSQMSERTKAGEGKPTKPSEILRYVFSEGPVATAVKPRFMTTEKYFNDIVNPRLPELDETFLKGYEQSKDEPAAWQELKDYFKKHIITSPLVALKKKLVAEDQERLELARKGVFFCGSTVIIDPSHAKE